MPTPFIDDALLIEACRLAKEYGSVTQAAQHTGVPYSTLSSRVHTAKTRLGIEWRTYTDAQSLAPMTQPRTSPSAYQADAISTLQLNHPLHSVQPPPQLQPQRTQIIVESGPDADEPLDDLIARRKKQIDRKRAADDFAKLIPVSVNANSAICLVHVGDPHVDDDGCDITQLDKDLQTIRSNDGMFACHLGDITNNWIGRLARLWANQATTARDALRLAQWVMEAAPQLYTVMGNHDLWQGSDFLAYIARQAGAVAQPNGVRMNLKFPNAREVRIHARHDFPGNSQYNATHGMVRETLFGYRDHLLIAGHKHVDSVHAEPTIDGLVSWKFRVSGYKIIDDYADEKRFVSKRMGPSLATIIDPHARIEAELIKPFWDMEEAADFLKFKRGSGKHGS